MLIRIIHLIFKKYRNCHGQLIVIKVNGEADSFLLLQYKKSYETK